MSSLSTRRNGASSISERKSDIEVAKRLIKKIFTK